MNTVDLAQLQNRDIIMFGIQNWEEKLGSNPRNIAYEFAKTNRVLYVDMPLFRIKALREANKPDVQEALAVIRGEKKPLSQVDDNIYLFRPTIMNESINWIPNRASGIFDRFNKRNNRILASEIQNAIDDLGMKDVIMFYDNDLIRGFYLKDMLSIDMFVFYMRDFLSAMNYWKKHGSRLEPELLAKADVIVANSEYYARYCKRYNRNSHFVGQGCDIEHFNPDNIKGLPEDIIAIKAKDPDKPIIGYVGVIYSMRLDEKIILQIAEDRNDWNIVLVGPEDDLFSNSELHNMDNVHFLGFKDMSTLPDYMNSFDVCINPQGLNPVTIGNYPLKIDEYLAMKKPVVATRTLAMKFFEEYCYLAEDGIDYILKIEEALKYHTAEKAEAGAAFANSHTWENNVKEIYKAINLTYQKRKGIAREQPREKLVDPS